MHQLQKDDTIIEAWPHLINQRLYVAGAYQKMRMCFKQHGNAEVRIGVLGTGQKPCYRITYKHLPKGDEVIFGSFWDTHDPLENEHAETNNWSTRTMSFTQVEAFLTEKVKKKT